MKANPFFELYVGDRISTKEFVTLFSPELVTYTEGLFIPGNIVVTGIQGCGKSMLLSLLSPKVRLEYERVNEPFPVRQSLRKFICGSVNLSHSNVIDFGHRGLIDSNVLKVELMFGDFLNYLLIESILQSIEIYANSSELIRSEIGLNIDSSGLDKLVAKLAKLSIWEGWFEGCETFASFMDRISKRTQSYRRYVHFKDDELDPQLFDTSTSIGAPLIELSKFLKENEFIDEDTNVFADIDQYEELGNISSRNTPGQVVDYRAVINKALSSRTPYVSYRIGTRKHSWSRHGKIHGTVGNLELTRHYKYIDLDSILRKDEFDSARSKNVFSDFATDVFTRRLKFAEFNVPSDNSEQDALEIVYGKHISSKDKVNKHYGLRQPERYIKLPTEWSNSSKKVLVELAKKDLFSAKLGEIWLRQKGDVEPLDVRDEKLPWERHSNRWWRKERSQILAIQLASLSKQKSVWGGVTEIIELSGGSILAFLGLNQFIWSAWLQRNYDPKPDSTSLPNIGLPVQSIAILKASHEWVDMIAEQTGRSAERTRFVKKAAAVLRRKLMDDKKLSYPGANGFSLADEDLVDYPDVAEFLEELSDYGNMLMLPHTSKERDRRSRKKLYFHPIFCPSFGIPYIRTKEPYYAKVGEIAQWIYNSGYYVKLGVPEDPVQDSLI